MFRPAIITKSMPSFYLINPETTMTQIILSDLPETIQILLNQSQATGQDLTITQNGNPIAIISPIKKSHRAAFGVMKDSTTIIENIVEPSSNLVEWDALS
jgi:antitoxin (DNA-binding transcriptional repressor) of toxin-antitoxin stability system